MIGESSIAGVYVPTILLLAVAALLLTGLTTRLFAYTSAYRLVANRPLVDIALFVFILGLLSLLTGFSA